MAHAKKLLKGGFALAALFLGIAVGRDLAHKYVPSASL